MTSSVATVADRRRVDRSSVLRSYPGARPGDWFDVVGPDGAPERLASKLEVRARVGADDDDGRRGARGLVPFGACLLRAMAELLAEARGGGDGGDALRIDGVAVPGPVREADPQASRIRTDLRQERPLLRRRPVGIAHVRSARRIEERGTVAHRPRDRMGGPGPVPGLADVGPRRRARPRR